jgi:hypothetical protein
MLATDALSQWILENMEAHKDVLSVLRKIKTQTDFEKFVSDALNSKEIPLKDDDITLVVLEINGEIILPFSPKKHEKKTVGQPETKVEKEEEKKQENTDMEKVDDKNCLVDINKLKTSVKRLKIALLTLSILACILFFIVLSGYSLREFFFHGDTEKTRTEDSIPRLQKDCVRKTLKCDKDSANKQ